MSFSVMRGQAGNRLIITRKERIFSCPITSHYSSLNEFWSLHGTDDIEWYKIEGQDKVVVNP